MRLDYRLEIARSPSEIFSFAANLENDALWQSAVVKVVKLSSGRARVGSRYLHVIRVLGKEFRAETEIVAFEPDAHYSIISVTGPMRFRTRVHLFGESTTEVRIRIDAEVPSGLGVVVHSLTRARRKQIEADLGNLKHKLESRQL